MEVIWRKNDYWKNNYCNVDQKQFFFFHFFLTKLLFLFFNMDWIFSYVQDLLEWFGFFKKKANIIFIGLDNAGKR